MHHRIRAAFPLLASLLMAPLARADVTPEELVRSYHKISAATDGPALEGNDVFGCDVAALGDLDGDGYVEVAIGARGDDGSSNELGNSGAIYILTLNPNGSVKEVLSKISDSDGDPGNHLTLPANGQFGRSVTLLGDYDGDGAIEIAVGAYADVNGAVWILDIDRQPDRRERCPQANHERNRTADIGDRDD